LTQLNYDDKALLSCRNNNILLFKLILLTLFRPFDEGFWGTIQVQQFGIEVFLESELVTLSHKVNVQAKLENAIDVWHLSVDDFEGDVVKETSDEARDHEDKGSVQAEDSA
jgi:hypothetical protein